MNSGANLDVGRARTAVVRAGLRLAGVEWEDGDEEGGDRYGMRVIFWRKWEAYGAAIWMGVFLVCCGVFVLGRVVGAGEWVFWPLVPVAVVAAFLGVQVVLLGGLGLGALVGRVTRGRASAGAGWAGGAVLVWLSGMALWMCVEGGVEGWVMGLIWLVPVGVNAGVWCVERVVGGE